MLCGLSRKAIVGRKSKHKYVLILYLSLKTDTKEVFILPRFSTLALLEVHLHRKKISASYIQESLHLFRNTLLPVAGPSAAAATFFPVARTPISFFFTPAGAFLAFFTIVVPVDALDVLLELLTLRESSSSCALSAPRLVLVPCTFAFFVVVAFGPVAVFGRPTLGFSLSILARAAVATAAAALAGEVAFTGE